MKRWKEGWQDGRVEIASGTAKNPPASILMCIRITITYYPNPVKQYPLCMQNGDTEHLACKKGVGEETETVVKLPISEDTDED